MREEDRKYLCRWAYFRGFILTCNEDDSIPINAQVVLDLSIMAGSEQTTAAANRIVAMHNEMLDTFRKS